MFEIPEDYVVLKFFTFAGKPSKNRFNNTYQGSCPMCREGNSWLKKRRFYFIPEKNLLFCHNCGYSKSSLRWILDVTGLSFNELKEELSNIEINPIKEKEEEKKLVVDTLPKDCINLFDSQQISFYRNNNIVKRALEFLEKRRLINAVNRPTFYLSLTDKVHKNRLIIPFLDENNKIVYYQSRTILESDEHKPRYISKINGEKTIFNFNNIDMDLDKIYIFEGPINSCFVKNGVAIGGIQENSYQLFTKKQQDQIDKIPLHKRIWVLDSQWKDRAAFNKTKKLLELKEKVFVWPKELGETYKDFNDITIALKSDFISSDFIDKRVY